MGTGITTNGPFVNPLRFKRGLIFGSIIVAALLAFEIFNYSTTEFALSDLLGDLKFIGIRWATILSIAFCGIDFAGIARLFTPQDESGSSSNSHTETWYLFGAWILAATMNAMLTWWGVSLAILNHETLGNAVVERETLLRVVPIFVALMVWLIRVLIIGTFSVAGDHIFGQNDLRLPYASRPHLNRAPAPQPTLSNRPANLRSAAPASGAPRVSHKTNSMQVDTGAYANRQEPTYHPLSASGAGQNSARTTPQPRTENGRSFTSFRQ